MALPKLDTPTYQLELPSNQQVVKYRPFLVKEQKILMMAQDADDKEDSYNMLAEIVDGCTFNNVDIIPFITSFIIITFCWVLEYILRYFHFTSTTNSIFTF